jgi:hypothetical protein
MVMTFAVICNFVALSNEADDNDNKKIQSIHSYYQSFINIVFKFLTLLIEYPLLTNILNTGIFVYN